MPSVLIEIGFLSNPKESKKLLTADYQGKVADKIYDALVSYKEKVDKTGLKTLN
ncbi:Germination-specific N-acetylmuramoyl-L-alanine amidase precursor [compost metagenome]